MLMRFLILICLSSVLAFAESWSGTLVDSRCFENEERNVNPTDTLTAVDRDQNLGIRYCSPSLKTRIFSVVQSDGLVFRLDSAGNARAVEMMRSGGKKGRLVVTVTGVKDKNAIKVDSISLVR